MKKTTTLQELFLEENNTCMMDNDTLEIACELPSHRQRTIKRLERTYDNIHIAISDDRDIFGHQVYTIIITLK